MDEEDDAMRARDIMHPEDAKAIQVIKGVPGCERLVRWFMKCGYELQYRGENLANMLRVTSQSSPDLYGLFREVVKQVGVREPELYVYNDPVMNAYTYGETQTFVAVSSGLVEKMSRKELKGVLAHECGHILCRHVLYLTMFKTLQEMGSVLGMINRALYTPLLVALTYWQRKGELSADRCGAAVAGEENYQRALVKLASGLGDATGQAHCLVEQGREYEAFKRSSLWNRVQQEYRCLFYSHPQLCTRALELDRWRMSYAYRSLRNAVWE